MELERMDGHGSFVEEEEDFLVLSFVLEVGSKRKSSSLCNRLCINIIGDRINYGRH